MKLLTLALGTFLSFSLFAADTTAPAPRTLELHTEKVGEAIHWMPEKVEVTQGEKVIINAKHETPGGFDFHGLTIKSLGIATKVDRGTPFNTPVTVPANLTPGEYDIGCQFHPAHKSAKLVVKGSVAPSATPAAPAEPKIKKRQTPKAK